MIARRSNCTLCGYLCGTLAYYSEDGNLVRVEPDSTRFPYKASIMKKCARFHETSAILDHPDRINYPIKRMGERGSGKWQRVSWDEALDDIAGRVQDLKKQYGAEALATCIGAPHSMYWPMHRFMNLFGSPNNIGIGHICWNPAIWVHSLTYGWPITPELDPDRTNCVILWGINPAESDNSLFWETIFRYSQSGKPLIVIDPRYTKTAAKASMWLPTRPGTDVTLALAMINVIIEEELYDKGFVNKWCSGFEELKNNVAGYSPNSVSSITGINSQIIIEIAHLFAENKPATIFSGLGIDQSGRNCTQALRALAILRAITGNVDRPGACHLCEQPDFISEAELEMSSSLPASCKKKQLGQNVFPLLAHEGYEALTRYTLLHGKRLPVRYLTSAHPFLAWQAMLTGNPYPIKALIVMASNPLLTQANTNMVYQAFKSLDLIVVLEQFLTPTAMLADYVLPSAGSLEQSMIQMNGGISNIAYGGTRAVAPMYERMTDYSFWYELGQRCGQTKYWLWKTAEEALDEIFSRAGLTWEEFCRTGIYSPNNSYYKYENEGFATPSGKIELHSILLEQLGYNPLPDFTHSQNNTSDYPLTLVTGVRHQPYYATEFRNIEKLRRIHPNPIAEMDRITATRFGVQEGDHIWIETLKGRIKQVVGLADMLQGLVCIEFGWWYPELLPEEPALGGLWESNANVLTDSDIESCDPILGQWSYRTLQCKIYKVDEAKGC